MNTVRQHVTLALCNNYSVGTRLRPLAPRRAKPQPRLVRMWTDLEGSICPGAGRPAHPARPEDLVLARPITHPTPVLCWSCAALVARGCDD